MDTIFVTNASTQVSDHDVAKMTAACAKQLALHLAPTHGRLAVPVIFAPQASLKRLPTRARIITVMNTCDDPQALGYHTEDGSEHIWGVVGTQIPLANGSSAFTGPYSVSSILSHEVMELFIDPYANGWLDTEQGFAVAWEVSDPCQGDSYQIDGVQVSNFVTAEWFDPQAAPGVKFDYLGKMSKPFQLDAGGYWVQLAEGNVTQKFGEAVPVWVEDMRRDNPYGRLARRTAV